eukprot:scaffold4296_cov137-Cylindrotheca_fusiformis.AAC.1
MLTIVVTNYYYCCSAAAIDLGGGCRLLWRQLWTVDDSRVVVMRIEFGSYHGRDDSRHETQIHLVAVGWYLDDTFLRNQKGTVGRLAERRV